MLKNKNECVRHFGQQNDIAICESISEGVLEFWIHRKNRTCQRIAAASVRVWFPSLGALSTRVSSRVRGRRRGPRRGEAATAELWSESGCPISSLSGGISCGEIGNCLVRIWQIDISLIEHCGSILTLSVHQLVTMIKTANGCVCVCQVYPLQSGREQDIFKNKLLFERKKSNLETRYSGLFSLGSRPALALIQDLRNLGVNRDLRLEQDFRFETTKPHCAENRLQYMDSHVRVWREVFVQNRGCLCVCVFQSVS